MGNSFQAADRLLRENNVAFASPFIYVINIRLAVLKDHNPNYFRVERYRQEFRAYITHLRSLISQINNSISHSYTVEVTLIEIMVPEIKPPVVARFWTASYLHNGMTVATFRSDPRNGASQTARDAVEQQARAARAAAVEADRQQLGVVEMEQTAAAWERAFVGPLLGDVAEGDVIKSSDDPAVFLIENGQRRWVPDEPTFLAKWTWDQVKTLPAEVVNAIPRGPDLPSVA